MTSLCVAWHTKGPPPVWGPVGRLDFDAGLYRFAYTRGAEVLPGFEPLAGLPNLHQVYELNRLLRECPGQDVRLFVERVNHDAPTQQRLLCRLEASWPDGFRPCQGLEFEPLVTGVTSG